jgi:hypothetical protein
VGAFLVSTGIVALAKTGAKTQLLSLLLSERFRWPWPTILGILVASAPLPCAAALSDEIEVFDDAIAPAGQTQITIHLNTSSKGRTAPDYEGEVVPHRTWRTMLELAHGVTRDLELGLHIPFLQRDGTLYAAGFRPRLRWIPKRPADGAVGAFYGFNLEYSQLSGRFERPRRHLEWKPIVGWRGNEWLFAANPGLTAWLSDGPKPNPELSLNAMVKRRMSEDVRAGIEFYSNYGPLGAFFPRSQRDRMLFLAGDVRTNNGYHVNAGIGRGLTGHSDHTVLKMVITLPY